MYETTLQASIAEDGLDSFVICLALGTLIAIKEGKYDPEVGIWTLARPIFRELLEKNKLVSPDVLEVLQTADELSLAIELDPVAGGESLDRCITTLIAALPSVKEPSWYLQWQDDGD